MKTGYELNEYGHVVSAHVCEFCGDTFTVIPPIPDERADEWRGCLAPHCRSYDSSRDADKLFDSVSTVNCIITKESAKPETKQ
jgi:hypothetical protein